MSVAGCGLPPLQESLFFNAWILALHGSVAGLYDIGTGGNWRDGICSGWWWRRGCGFGGGEVLMGITGWGASGGLTRGSGRGRRSGNVRYDYHTHMVNNGVGSRVSLACPRDLTEDLTKNGRVTVGTTEKSTRSFFAGFALHEFI